MSGAMFPSYSVNNDDLNYIGLIIVNKSISKAVETEIINVQQPCIIESLNFTTSMKSCLMSFWIDDVEHKILVTDADSNRTKRIMILPQSGNGWSSGDASLYVNVYNQKVGEGQLCTGYIGGTSRGDATFSPLLEGDNNFYFATSNSYAFITNIIKAKKSLRVTVTGVTSGSVFISAGVLK